jgi:hypothetical protein
MALSFWFRIPSAHVGAAQPSSRQLSEAQSRSSLHVTLLAQGAGQSRPQSMPASVPFRAPSAQLAAAAPGQPGPGQSVRRQLATSSAPMQLLAAQLPSTQTCPGAHSLSLPQQTPRSEQDATPASTLVPASGVPALTAATSTRVGSKSSCNNVHAVASAALDPSVQVHTPRATARPFRVPRAKRLVDTPETPTCRSSLPSSEWLCLPPVGEIRSPRRASPDVKEGWGHEVLGRGGRRVSSCMRPVFGG